MKVYVVVKASKLSGVSNCLYDNGYCVFKTKELAEYYYKKELKWPSVEIIETQIIEE